MMLATIQETQLINKVGSILTQAANELVTVRFISLKLDSAENSLILSAKNFSKPTYRNMCPEIPSVTFPEATGRPSHNVG